MKDSELKAVLKEASLKERLDLLEGAFFALRQDLTAVAERLARLAKITCKLSELITEKSSGGES